MSAPSRRLSRRSLLIAGAAGAATAGLSRVGMAAANTGPQSYTASWSSVDQHLR